jgi:hypothetical protein
MEHERGALGLVESYHRSDEYHMVAAFVPVRRTALKTRRAALEKRDVIRPSLYCQGSEFIGTAGGKTLCEIILRRGQYMDREVLSREKCREAQGMT